VCSIQQLISRQCNLEPPICANCERRKEPCDYQFRDLEGAVSRPVAAGPRRSFSSALSSQYQTQQNPQSDLIPEWAHGPSLMSIVLRPQSEESRSLSKRLIVQTDSYSFLRHNLLAISALYHSRPLEASPTQVPCAVDEQYMAACEHQILASRLFRDSVHSVTDGNWFAILAFAITVLIFHLDVSRRGRSEDFLETIFVLRCGAVLGVALGPWLMRSRLLAAMRRHREEAKWDDEAETALNNLVAVNDLWPGDTRVRYACRDAINQLRSWLRLFSCRPQTWLRLVWWPGEISDEFLSLLANRHPAAIVVFVHWCAIMSSGPKRWFLDGWAQRTAGSALAHLGPGWDDATVWARSKLQAAL